MGKLVRSLMSGRIPKEMFKSLKKAKFEMNPFDETAVTARELLKRMSTRPVRLANPKLNIEVEVVDEYGSPSVTLTYNDDQEQTLRTGLMQMPEVMEEIEKVARWKTGDVVNPFGKVREERAKALGLQ